MKPSEKISRKVYYALMYSDGNHFAALDPDSGEPYKVDDISLAWLRRESIEFEDFCKQFPELEVVKITFNIQICEK